MTAEQPIPSLAMTQTYNDIRMTLNSVPDIPERPAFAASYAQTKFIDAKALRTTTGFEIGGQKTNLVDHLAADKQIIELFNLLLGYVDIPNDFMEDSAYFFKHTKGAKPTHLDKAKIIGMIVKNLDKKIPASGTNNVTFMDELVEESAKWLKGSNKTGNFGRLEILTALVAAGRIELAEFLLEKPETTKPIVTAGNDSRATLEALAGAANPTASVTVATTTPVAAVEPVAVPAVDTELAAHVSEIKGQLKAATEAQAVSGIAVAQAMAQNIKDNPNLSAARGMSINMLRAQLAAAIGVLIGQVPVAGGVILNEDRMKELFPHVPDGFHRIMKIADFLKMLPEVPGIEAIIYGIVEEVGVAVEGVSKGVKGTAEVAQQAKAELNKYQAARQRLKEIDSKSKLVDAVAASPTLTRESKIKILDRLVSSDNPLTPEEIKNLEEYFTLEGTAAENAEAVIDEMLKKEVPPLYTREFAYQIAVDDEKLRRNIEEDSKSLKAPITQEILDTVIENVQMLMEQSPESPAHFELEGAHQRAELLKQSIQEVGTILPKASPDRTQWIASCVFRLAEKLPDDIKNDREKLGIFMQQYAIIVNYL